MLDRLKNIALPWKIGGAILVSLAVCLVFVRFSFERAIDDAGDELWNVVTDLAQAKVNADLEAARTLYDGLVEDISSAVTAVAMSSEISTVVSPRAEGAVGVLQRILGRRIGEFSFLAVIDGTGRVVRLFGVTPSRDGLARFVPAQAAEIRTVPRHAVFEQAFRGHALAGTMILPPPILDCLGLADAARVRLRKGVEGKAASPGKPAFEGRGLVVAAVVPVRTKSGVVLLFGGRLLNNDTAFVDSLKKIFYSGSSGRSAGGKRAEAGTATVFMGRLRVSTNVVGPDGRRAVGTVVSLPVERAVLRDGNTFLDRAEVVGRWYFAAYRPIVDVFGERVGILYVGVPESAYRLPQQVMATGLKRRMRGDFYKALVFSVFVAMFVAYLGTRLVLRPMHALQSCIERMARGDLRVNVDVHGEDEVGILAAAFDKMASSLRVLTGRVAEAARAVNLSAGQIGETMKRHGSTTAQQSAAVSETTATLEELAASSRQIADNALQVVKMATKTLDSARTGVEEAERTLRQMEEIRRADSEDISRIRALSARLTRIDEVMTLIDTIADQTRLIAFNAAIEAAAAGEAGKRFGVVSAEIRRLAATTRERSSEIRDYLGEIRNAADSLVESRETTSVSVGAGVEATRKVGERLRDIRDDSATMLSSSKQISLATQQQRTATEQTLSAVREINAGIEQLARGARDTEEEIEKLAVLAKSLSEHIEHFEI